MVRIRTSHRPASILSLGGYRLALIFAVAALLVFVAMLRLRARARRLPVAARVSQAPIVQVMPPEDRTRPEPASNLPAEPPGKETAGAPVQAPGDEGPAETPQAKEERLLGRVQDQYPLYIREQKEAYYYLLQKAKRLSYEEVCDRLDPDIDYAMMTESPHIARGSVVEVAGLLLRVVKTPMEVE